MNVAKVYVNKETKQMQTKIEVVKELLQKRNIFM